jgi:hypothetical protein
MWGSAVDWRGGNVAEQDAWRLLVMHVLVSSFTYSWFRLSNKVKKDWLLRWVGIRIRDLIQILSKERSEI